MEPRLGRTLHSSATGRHRERTLPEALGLRQAVQPRDDTAGSAGSEARTTSRPQPPRGAHITAAVSPAGAATDSAICVLYDTGDMSTALGACWSPVAGRHNDISDRLRHGQSVLAGRHRSGNSVSLILVRPVPAHHPGRGLPIPAESRQRGSGSLACRASESTRQWGRPRSPRHRALRGRRRGQAPR